MQVNLEKRVTKIEANPLLIKNNSVATKLRVAAYCRVSTDEEEQLNSYESQIAYYTEAIAKNPSWTFAGVYADEGITGTVTSKRKDFLRLMRDCEKGKIDMILTKSISRFARNTVDSLSWVRKLRAMNIGVYFEEQAIDSLKAENEMLIGLFSVIAQAESENISANVKWGIHQSMKSGKFCSNFSCFGYKRGANGVPEIIPEQAEVVRIIFDRFLDGSSLEQIQRYLQDNGFVTYKGGKAWNKKVIDTILKNEKYAGDLLLQKTYCSDPISKKTKVNRGELPKYLVSNNHPAIIDRDKFNRVQMEIARRGSKHKKSSLAKTEQGKYSGKFALSELLVCGECGSNYKRNGKTKKNGEHQYYWRCINRSENGSKSCSSIGIEETKLHSAICRALNKMFENKEETVNLLRSNLKYAITGSDDSCDAYSLEKQILKLEEESERLMELMGSTSGDTDRFLNEIKNNFEQVKILREKLQIAKISAESDLTINSELERLEKMFTDADVSFNEYDDVIVRRLIECIRVMKENKILVVLKGGLQTEECIL